MKKETDTKEELMEKRKIEITSIKDIEKVIEENFPDGLEADKFDSYIGFNLCRFSYKTLLAAECHAMTDRLNGVVGYSYGFPFDPYVVTHDDSDGKWFEVWTG